MENIFLLLTYEMMFVYLIRKAMKVHSFENHQNIYLMILDVQKILFPKKDLYLRIKYEVHEVWPNPLFMFFITFTMSVQFRESSKHIWPNKIQISLVLDIYFIYVKSHFKMLFSISVLLPCAVYATSQLQYIYQFTQFKTNTDI